jgi:hypothetical protein
MAEQRCGTCRWHDVAHLGDVEVAADAQGECRRFPPHVDVAARWSRMQQGQDVDDLPGIWPETSVQDWCGEWQAKEPPAL